MKPACIMRLLHALLLIFWAGQAFASEVFVLDLDGAITPGVADYVVRGLKLAADKHAKLAVLRMDTPGGLDSSMREIIKQIIASSVPVAAFVAPDGARAASAGTYILYASHIAAMTQASNLGAATPVEIGIGLPSGDRPHSGVAGAAQENPMEQKRINDAAAYIRSLAQLRGRNVEWAEQSVRQGASLTAAEALKLNVIDVIASDVPDLVRRLDGRTLPGARRTLDIAGADIVRIRPDWRSKILAVIADPNIAYLLMLAGIFGIFFELSNPGFMLPGVTGVISLLIALYAFEVLPVNFAGLALMLFGLALMAAEVFVSGFGAFGVGGIIAFVIGSVLLIDTDTPGYGLPLSLIVPVAIISSLFVSYASTMALKTRNLPVVSGREELIGSTGNVLSIFSGNEGSARLHGEIWRIRSRQALAAGQKIRVVGIAGLILNVEPADATAGA